MKIIDLLNKIANGEEVPEKIKFGDDIYHRKTDANEGYVIDYLDNRDNSLFNFITDYKFCFIKSCLEWEIKDLEEEKKIPEKLEEFGLIQYNLEYIDYKNIETLKDWLNKDFQTIYDTLDLIIKNQNKLIDYLKSKGE